jgi:hypothetical protein
MIQGLASKFTSITGSPKELDSDKL